MIKPAVNTIVHAAHAAAADDGLREASVVNIEMKGGGGRKYSASPYNFCFSRSFIPCMDYICAKMFANMRRRCSFLYGMEVQRLMHTYTYLILCRPDIKKIAQAPISPALAQWRQKDLRRTSEGSQKDLRRTSEGPWVFPRNALAIKNELVFFI